LMKSQELAKMAVCLWPKNTEDLKRFKEMTLNGVVIMGRLTWDDPNMPTPLTKRVNVLVTSKPRNLYPGADQYISGNLIEDIQNIFAKYKNKNIWVIGGANLIDQIFNLIDIFHITHIKGKYNCDKKLNLDRIKKNMQLINSELSKDASCVFETWKRN